ncbi:hypothetical protein [Leucobacter sp. G161]|uniref:hypothetical protein n=1 Tax=Leucobacter sp. G161 TaxID=663704 RepID=UPI00073AF227|nr:hypothetical protein [Leucobacter sp. G161]KUF08434.1 hypothetical protein AUL38_04580 [Leucobacter sp. G161]
MKLKASTNKKISVALGVLTAIAACVLILGDTWGFPALAKQIFASITGMTAIVNVYFLGSTAEKITKGQA